MTNRITEGEFTKHATVPPNTGWCFLETSWSHAWIEMPEVVADRIIADHTALRDAREALEQAESRFTAIVHRAIHGSPWQAETLHVIENLASAGELSVEQALFALRPPASGDHA